MLRLHLQLHHGVRSGWNLPHLLASNKLLLHPTPPDLLVLLQSEIQLSIPRLHHCDFRRHRGTSIQQNLEVLKCPHPHHPRRRRRGFSLVGIRKEGPMCMGMVQDQFSQVAAKVQAHLTLRGANRIRYRQLGAIGRIQ